MGNDDLDVLQLLLGEEPQLLGFTADPHLGLLLKVQAEDHDDHAPDAAVTVGGDAARLAVGAKTLESFLRDPDAQLLLDLPLHGLEFRLVVLHAAAHEAPYIGVPALLQQQTALTGDDGVGAQMGTHGGLGGVGIAPVEFDDGHDAFLPYVFRYHTTTREICTEILSQAVKIPSPKHIDSFCILVYNASIFVPEGSP